MARMRVDGKGRKRGVLRGCRKVAPFLFGGAKAGTREGKRGREESCPVGRGFHEGRRALLPTLDFAMPPAGGRGVRGYTRLLRRQSCVVAHARLRYVSDGQGACALRSPSVRLALCARLTAAAKRRPLASPRSGGRCPPGPPNISCAASSRRQLPFGAGRLRVICRRCRQCAQNSRWPGKAAVPVSTDILHRIPAPPASLRRKAPSGDLATGMRCAQGSRWDDEARGSTLTRCDAYTAVKARRHALLRSKRGRPHDTREYSRMLVPVD